MIHFNYKGNKYTIIAWSLPCKETPCNLISSGLMEIKKVGGKVSKLIQYSEILSVKDFLSKLETINFM